jgi:hypothetical protein
MAVLALLMAGTSWAVASWVSVWLVPPYLILMALLLFPSAGRLHGDPAEAESARSNPLQPAMPGEDLDGAESAPDGSASAESSEGNSEPGAASSPTRARRGKGRAKKAKPVPEPAEATWIEVAPGKFVRVEASETSGQAGPHAPLGVPVEVPSTPQPWLAEEGNPIGEVESESRAGLEVDETAGSPELSEGPSAADGNAPRAEGSLEELEAPGSGADFEADHDRAEADPSGESMEDDEGERSSLSNYPEPVESLALADVPSEEVDGWGETEDEADPTEITVDETDLDDAGPFNAEPHDHDLSEDADVSETEAFPASSECATWWPRRLAPRAGTRVGHPLRSTGRGRSPRRPIRSVEAARHPLDPRRLTRRGAGRPRQIIRTLPPRSPPWVVSG